MRGQAADRLLAAALTVAAALCADSCADTSNGSPRPSIGAVAVGPVSPRVSRFCELASRRTSVVIPCPTVAPTTTARWVLCRGTDGRIMGQGCPRNRFVVEEHFVGPPAYAGIPGPAKATRSGHLIVWAIASVGRRTFVTVGSCRSAELLSEERVAAKDGRWYDCPDGARGIDSGHVMFVWTAAATTYAVTAHSDSPANRQLIEQVVSGIRLISRS
jgi:hypothetical protein